MDRTLKQKGNTTFANLIEEAIESSEEKRLTLQDIYIWFSNNVEEFYGKIDERNYYLTRYGRWLIFELKYV